MWIGLWCSASIFKPLMSPSPSLPSDSECPLCATAFRLCSDRRDGPGAVWYTRLCCSATWHALTFCRRIMCFAIRASKEAMRVEKIWMSGSRSLTGCRPNRNWCENNTTIILLCKSNSEKQLVYVCMIHASHEKCDSVYQYPSPLMQPMSTCEEYEWFWTLIDRPESWWTCAFAQICWSGFFRQDKITLTEFLKYYKRF